MNAQPVYLICAEREDGERYKAAAAAVLHRHGPAVVVTEVAELRKVQRQVDPVLEQTVPLAQGSRNR